MTHNYNPTFPYNMSTHEIQEELLALAHQANEQGRLGYYPPELHRRIGALELELQEREDDHPADWGREIAHG